MYTPAMLVVAAAIGAPTLAQTDDVASAPRSTMLVQSDSTGFAANPDSAALAQDAVALSVSSGETAGGLLARPLADAPLPGAQLGDAGFVGVKPLPMWDGSLLGRPATTRVDADTNKSSMIPTPAALAICGLGGAFCLIAASRADGARRSGSASAQS